MNKKIRITILVCTLVDCWDGGGDEGPLIHHGGTLTSSITFKDVLQKGIKPHAFSVSQYPVILSLENHCGQIYQNRMAHHLKTILGALIYTRDENNLQELPSPEELKGKIIIKASKRLKLSDAFRSFVNVLCNYTIFLPYIYIYIFCQLIPPNCNVVDFHS